MDRDRCIKFNWRKYLKFWFKIIRDIGIIRKIISLSDQWNQAELN